MKTPKNVNDVIRKQAGRNLLALSSVALFALPSILAGLLLSFWLYSTIINIAPDAPMSCLDTILLLPIGFLGIIPAGLIGNFLWLLVMKRVLNIDEMYSWALYGGYVPVLTHLGIVMTRIALRGPRPANTLNGLITQIEGMGFYKYGGSAELANAALHTANDGWYYDLSTLRFYQLEQGTQVSGEVVSFVRKLQPFLEREGASIQGISQEASKNQLVITIGARKYIGSTSTEEHAGVARIHSLVRGFAIVNELLAEAGSNERLYAFIQAEKTYAGFLKPQMYGLLLESPLIKRSEKPVSAPTLITRLLPGN